LSDISFILTGIGIEVFALVHLLTDAVNGRYLPDFLDQLASSSYTPSSSLLSRALPSSFASGQGRIRQIASRAAAMRCCAIALFSIPIAYGCCQKKRWKRAWLRFEDPVS
jgi:hypothetical protein